ncbi:MAG: hypothetical protein WC849_02735 [Candidatus Paceibacterota bacterium]
MAKVIKLNIEKALKTNLNTKRFKKKLEKNKRSNEKMMRESGVDRKKAMETFF